MADSQKLKSKKTTHYAAKVSNYYGFIIKSSVLFLKKILTILFVLDNKWDKYILLDICQNFVQLAISNEQLTTILLIIRILHNKKSTL